MLDAPDDVRDQILAGTKALFDAIDLLADHDPKVAAFVARQALRGSAITWGRRRRLAVFVKREVRRVRAARAEATKASTKNDGVDRAA